MPQTLTEAARRYASAWIREPVSGSVAVPSYAVKEFSAADLTTVSPTFDFGFPGMNYFRAVVNLKAFVGGTDDSLIFIDAGDDVGLAVNNRRPGLVSLPIMASIFTVVMEGVCPDGPKRYARLVFGAGAGASATFDVILCGAP